MKLIITHKCTIVINGENVALAKGAKVELSDYDSRLLVKANCAAPLEGAESIDEPIVAPSAGSDDSNDTNAGDDIPDAPESAEEVLVNPLMFKPLPHIGDGLSRLLTLEMGITSEAALLKVCNETPDKLIAIRGLNAERVAEVKAALDERAGAE